MLAGTSWCLCPRCRASMRLNAYLEERCLERLGRQLRGHRETIGQRMERDLEALLGAPRCAIRCQ